MIVHQFVMSHVTVVFLDSKLNEKVHSDVLAFFFILLLCVNLPNAVMTKLMMLKIISYIIFKRRLFFSLSLYVV